MKSQRELIEEHRKNLDKKFFTDYPTGKFAAQKFRGCNFLHWCPGRNVGAVKHRGITTIQNLDRSIDQYNCQNSSFGQVKNANSLDKVVAIAKKCNFTEEMIQSFVERYNNRSREGFSVQKI